MRSRIMLAAALCLLGACAQFPELDQKTDASVQAMPYPALLPYDQLHAAIAAPPPPDPAPGLEAAAAVLRQRADAQQAQP